MEGWAARYKIMPDRGRQIISLLDQMDHSIGALSACKVLFLPRQELAKEHLSRALWWSTLVDETVLWE